MSSYANDGRCHNAEPGTYGHECGKPAPWVGTNRNGFSSGYCDRCKESGSEARDCVTWTRVDIIPPGRLEYWGAPCGQPVTVIPGVVWVTSPSHGGLVLSDARNALMPDYMRRPDAVYEEDCNWCLPILAFDIAKRFALALGNTDQNAPEQIMNDARRTMEHWHVKAYERAMKEPNPTRYRIIA